VIQQGDPARVIRSQVVLEEHDVDSDGRFAIVVRRFVAGDRYRSHLWLVPLGGRGRARARELTRGAVRDRVPRIAPDGRSVAFLRSAVPPRRRRSGAATPPDRVLILPLGEPPAVAPGSPWPIATPRDRAVSELAWSPDGRRLALAMEADPPRFIVGPPPRGEDEPIARRIGRIDWRHDDGGHLDRRTQLFVVEAARGARPRRLTEADWDVSGLAWSPDGERIAFSADGRRDSDLEPRRSIWTVAASGEAEPLETLALPGDVHSPAWSPDGRWLAAVGVSEQDADDDVSPTLVVTPADRRRRPSPIAPDLDRPIGSWIDTDLHGWTAGQRSAPCWVDECTIVALVSDRGRTAPWRFEVDPATGEGIGTPSPLVDGDVAADSLAVARGPRVDGGALATVLACLDSRPVELLTVPLADGPAVAADEAATPERRAARPAVRTSIGSRWSDRVPWPAMRSVQAPGAGGSIETWIASPAGAGDGPLPTVVDVHGGPLGAWAPAPSIEVVLLCARGYRVVLPNIRGSATYGKAWITPQLGDWGGVDAADVHAALDHVIALGLADPERLGILGLSYGGFMVNWLVGTTNRFKAAVSENGVTNQVAAWANSDTGVEYNRTSRLGAPLDRAGMEQLWRQSPLSNVANVRTPLLMLQAEADRRCPPADNEQLFIALRVLGRTVEYVLYPEEHHVYQAAGRPDRRIDRMTRMLDWFDRHLG
jgi:dipeptidyl aminopeptidase/acylaminoacyl peptidase